ncbi:aminotransferase class III-fold pyridoxal phosphate-dependent enzyme [Sabulicella rubraurantiaca]|uniref:aminotransferase class III-fold pyridoxal phosphate-dependent enzyme n=1 Tax=Sabulicella rubraurantiaca TaxID=2811429 RepID=UPI001A97A731|nr:aminotransferase class III-fold pyridoxal phosphate-dependent enzyme [Sabulicella rubraurantiaca]
MPSSTPREPALAGGVVLRALGALPEDGPTLFRSAQGARVTDAEGRSFLDLHNAVGAVILGHGDRGVARAVVRAARLGLGGVPSLAAMELAERLAPLLPARFRTAFFKSGSEALSAALRLARAAVGRDLVLATSYHGWHDWAATAPAGVPADTRALTLRAPHGDLAAVEALLEAHAGRIAAIVAEPMLFETTPSAWPAELRRLADRHGTLLIFDETITFLRVAAGGATRLSGIAPDLLCYGKGLANGLPLAALSGAPELMRRLERDVMALSAAALEGVAPAAAQAVLDRFEQEDVPAALARRGEALRAEFESALAEARMERAYRLVGGPSRMALRSPGGRREVFRLGTALLREGVHAPVGISPSLALGPAEIAEAGAAFARALKRLPLATEAPEPAFRMR